MKKILMILLVLMLTGGVALAAERGSDVCEGATGSYIEIGGFMNFVPDGGCPNIMFIRCPSSQGYWVLGNYQWWFVGNRSI